EVLALERTAKDVFAERIFDVLLDCTTQRAGTEVGVGPFLDEELLGVVGQLQRQAVVDQALAHLVQLKFDDVLEVIAAERAEDDDVIETADEFRAEEALKLLHERVLHLLVRLIIFRALAAGPQAERRHAALDEVRANVAGHDHDDVAEVDMAAE